MYRGILNQLFLSRIPDPTLRQTTIDTLIQDQGLPANLSNPVTLYTQQILLQETASATVGLLGARNSIYATVFYLHQEPIAGSGAALPPILAIGTLNDNTQQGASVVWTHNLTPSVTMNLTATALRTTANAPFTAVTNQGYATLTLTTPLSARTTRVRRRAVPDAAGQLPGGLQRSGPLCRTELHIQVTAPCMNPSMG